MSDFLERVFRVKGGCSCYGRTDAVDGWYFAPAAVADENLADGFAAMGPFASEAEATEQAAMEEREWSDGAQRRRAYRLHLAEAYMLAADCAEAEETIERLLNEACALDGVDPCDVADEAQALFAARMDGAP